MSGAVPGFGCQIGWADTPASFPVTEANSDGGSTYVSTTTYAITLPAGIAANDLILVLLGNSKAAAFTVSWPAGYTELFDANYPTGDGVSLAAAWAIAAGGETSVTVTFSATGAAPRYICYRFSGATSAEGTVGSEATTGSPNPGALSPTWGLAKTKWIAVQMNSQSRNITAYPSGYTNPLTSGYAEGSGTGLGRIGSAELDSEAASEDPGAFTLSTSTYTFAGTIGIKPG